MNIKQRTALLFFILLICPSIVYAHALSPTHYPLGPIPFMIVRESPLFVLMIPVALIVMTIILWAWICPPSFFCHLWRAIILYAVARLFETSILFIFTKIGWWTAPGWTSSSLENFGSLVVCLLGGIIPTALLGLFLYKNASSAKWRCIVAVVTANMGAYVAAFVCGLIMMASSR